MTAHVAAVCTVDSLYPVPSRGLVSGIDKRPINEPLRVLRHGVWGDVQGDREHHGGLFKAVYAYSRETREELARLEGHTGQWADGFFGENLVIAGADASEVVIGERWKVGSAELEGTCQRTPCATFSARIGDRSFPRRFTEFGKPGAYFRVVKEGEISAGDGIEVLVRPEHGVTIGDAFRGLNVEQAAALLDWSEATNTVLYLSLARACLTAVAREGQSREFPATLMSDGRGN